MRLSDIMSSLHLSSYAEAALLLFFCAFLAITWSVFSKPQETWERLRHQPLEPDDAAPPVVLPSRTPPLDQP
jgi:hypothetical protein